MVGGHLLTTTWAAAVGVQFRVKPKQFKWENSSQCPVLEIRRSNRGFYVQQGYTVCSAPYSISGFSLPGPGCASHGQRLYVCMLSIPFSSTPYLWNALRGFLPNWHKRLLMLRFKLCFLFFIWHLSLACQICLVFGQETEVSCSTFGSLYTSVIGTAPILLPAAKRNKSRRPLGAFKDSTCSVLSCRLPSADSLRCLMLMINITNSHWECACVKVHAYRICMSRCTPADIITAHRVITLWLRITYNIFIHVVHIILKETHNRQSVFPLVTS